MAGYNFWQAFDITIDDSTDEGRTFNWIMVTDVPGDVTYVSEGGKTYLISNCPINVWVPVGLAVRINDTNTTPTAILGA